MYLCVSNFAFFAIRQKSEQGVSPLDPAALPTAFDGRRGTFVFANETPMDPTFHRLVVYFLPSVFFATSWVRCWRLVCHNFPMMYQQIVSHEGLAKTVRGGQGGGKVRRIYMLACRFNPFPFLVAFFRYLSVDTDRKVHKNMILNTNQIQIPRRDVRVSPQI